MNPQTKINEIVEHFFRHESGKMISVLTGIFGSNKIQLAEDIVQDTIIEAISNWTYNGVPENPIAWLYTVAKNKTLNSLNREKKLEQIIINNPSTSNPKFNILDTDYFSADQIIDDQLRMMFVCCHPSISHDSQIALILKTLCGFNRKEIASSFLSNTESINKRLVRARKTIRENKIPFELPENMDMEKRLDAVLEAIYLLFNEGYNASNGKELIRVDLCNEAIRLAKLVVDHKAISQKSDVYALIALMQLNSSRFNAREDEAGNIQTLRDQNRSLWDFELMEQGFTNLEKATQGQPISEYHLMASISAYHCSAKDFLSTDWDSILSLYEKLYRLKQSPFIILNMAIALSHSGKNFEAMKQIKSIQNEKLLNKNYLFYSAKAEIHLQLKENINAKEALVKAMELAPLQAEKKLLESRIQKI